MREGLRQNKVNPVCFGSLENRKHAESDFILEAFQKPFDLLCQGELRRVLPDDLLEYSKWVLK